MERVTVALALSLGLLACQTDTASTATPASKPQPTFLPPVEPQKVEVKPPLPAPEDVAAPPADAQKSASGLVSKVIVAGAHTERPRAFDVVKVQYTGWTPDGTMFDSSVQRGEAAEFPLDAVMPGWTEGIQLMTLGETRRFWIPEKLGPRGQAGAPKGTLVYDIQLLDVRKLPEPPATPKELTAPSPKAKKTASGLASLVLTKGAGKEHPGPRDTVTVRYDGWNRDGQLFDSTAKRGMASTFALDRVIAGWTEGLQLMVVGEKRRFWIPAGLAYQGRPGPQGMLVYDMELLTISKAPELASTDAGVAAPAPAPAPTWFNKDYPQLSDEN